MIELLSCDEEVSAERGYVLFGRESSTKDILPSDCEESRCEGTIDDDGGTSGKLREGIISSLLSVVNARTGVSEPVPRDGTSSE